MTKVEKIKEAYGEFYNDVKEFLDENGWCKLNISQKHPINSFAHYEKTEWRTINGRVCWRPKCLQGIEDNNGWHCLSEKDFPEDELTVLWYSENTNEFENASLLHCDFNFEEYTHWHYLPTKAPIY